MREGDERGGVCGWFDEHGPAHVYLEVAGYYLTGLVAMASEDRACVERARVRADAVVGWLERHLARGALPRTRIYLRPHAGDWRCDVRFAFDLAMLARGLADAGALLPPARLAPILARALAEVGELVDAQGQLQACRPQRAGVTVPARWSTSAGFYQVKIAAALRQLPLALSPRLTAACDAVLARWSRPPKLAGELHPYLYGLEGAALLAHAGGDDAALARVAEASVAVSTRRDAQGCLPAHATGGACRFDVTAQAVRLLALVPGCAAAHGAAASLAGALTAAVDEHGAVRFGNGGADTPTHHNVWTALFAWQALSAHERDGECAAGDWAWFI